MPPFDPALAARYPTVIGCDEVGRGALSGPVVVAAVWFEPAASRRIFSPPWTTARSSRSRCGTVWRR